MASDATDEPRPVLTYASTAPEAAGGAQWVHSADGVRLVVPPPATWRRMAGPAFTLALMTPLVAFVLTGVGVLLYESLTGNLRLLLPAGLTVGVAAAGVGIWAGALTRLIRIARRGRRPFILRLFDAAFEITPAADDPLDPAVWPISAVVEVRLDTSLMTWSPLVRPARLQIAFHDGEGLATWIPWPDMSPLRPVEAELRRALGVDLPVPKRDSRAPHNA